MGGDFSRDSFDPAQHFARVLTQQGRLQLDADANEQVSILLHYLRTLAADLIGPYGGPIDPQHYGFKIGLTLDNQNKLADLSIGGGRYYVGGILVENEAPAPEVRLPAHGCASDRSAGPTLRTRPSQRRGPRPQAA